MLDSYGRKYVQPLIKLVADLFIKLKFSANQVTLLGGVIGIIASVLAYNRYMIFSVILLWVSGLLDAVDGTIARKIGSTKFGTLLDIVLDRIVELGLIIATGLNYPEQNLNLLILTSSIVVCMTIFLTIGLLSSKESEKSFYYQPGLGERTEGFIFFTGILLFPKYHSGIIIVFILVILYTSIQRIYEGWKILG